MMPNLDPRALKSMMSKMGITTLEVEADKVVISTKGKDIVIENPQVTQINAQGVVTFQIAGNVTEVSKEEEIGEIEVSDDDIAVVSEKTGITDKDLIRKALEESNGNIAEAILRLKEVN
ncbi:nascent polypeptide-associated complex protein [Candidatus Mancarchaeum acidiphilum]|uniref:Nascent polypeptide-associated complex protein n=1 Tax=Candidatus Mancarchaeum acidiphilum TaxID=1920749 RepID=A0A218NNY8_9ARCH|nr:nascent polypeptide-associated complex protein [Candidatus Mancarchaeum acidiphilum]ASI14181.1 nascent polypeptide-associated complex protein [Candidatus Mancarchaeum acidiphilum]